MKKPQSFIGEFYLDQIRQFGFIVLFANAFPLASIFCFFCNLFEIHLKMNEFLQFGRRPEAEGTGSIGSWINIMEFLAMLSIPTNLAAIYFSGGNGYGNNGSETDSPVVMWLMDKDYFWTRSNVILLIVAVEHALLLIKIFLATIIEDVPTSVVRAEKKRALIHPEAVKFIQDYK